MLIEVAKSEFLKDIDCVPFEKKERPIDCILPVSCRILQSAIHAVTNRQESFESESTIPLWKEAYYSLVMLEKMIHQFHDLCFSKDLEVNFVVLSIKYIHTDLDFFGGACSCILQSGNRSFPPFNRQTYTIF